MSIGPANAEQIAKLMDRHAAALALYASQWTAAAEDCVQEAFVELARQHAMPEQSVAWLYRVVRNRALNAARSQRRREFHEVHAGGLRLRVSGERGEHDTATLLEAMNGLEASAREVVVLRIWSGLGWEEIAQLLESSSSTAHRRYVAALERLKQMLEESCPQKTTPPNTAGCQKN